MKIEVRYLWRYKWGGRVVTSSVKMTEEQVHKESPDAIRLDDSREEVLVMDQPCEIDRAKRLCREEHKELRPAFAGLIGGRVLSRQHDPLQFTVHLGTVADDAFAVSLS